MSIPSNITNISPFIRLAWDHTADPPWVVTERVLFDYELIHIKSGKVEVVIDGETHIGQPGDFFYIRPGRPHSIKLLGDTPVRQPHIHFDFHQDADSEKVTISFRPMNEVTASERKLFRKDITDSFFPNFPSHIRLQNPVSIEHLMFDVIDEYNSALMHNEIILKGLFIQLWVQLLREVHINNQGSISNRERFNQIKRYIDTNINREVKLDELSDEFYLSKHYLCRMFHRVFNASPIDYHRMQRIKQAKKLVQFSEMSITEIAYYLGYSSVQAFSRAFKIVDGMPPTFYRNQTDEP